MGTGREWNLIKAEVFPEENNEEGEGEVVDGMQKVIVMMAQGS